MGHAGARVRRHGRTPTGLPDSAAVATPGLRGLTTTRLTLVCQGATAATRIAAFPRDGDALVERATQDWERLRARLGWWERAHTAPTRAARDTAAFLAATVVDEPALRDCAFGAWAGRSLAEIEASEPDAVAHWLQDPAAAPPGGEALATVVERLRGWLDRCAAGSGTSLAVASPFVTRALVVAALDLPLPVFWRLDAAPLSISRLTAQGNRWRLASFSAPA